MTTSISSEAQKIKSWMVICTSRFELYLLIDLLEKINTKPCFICIMITVTMGKIILIMISQKSFKTGPKTLKKWGKM